MKRFLLFVGVAVAAMTVNAQKLSPVAGEKSLVFEHKPVLCTSVNKNSGIVAKDMSTIAAKMQKAPAQGDFYGAYIEDNVEDIHACSAANLFAVTVEGKEYVKIVLDNEVISILGEYDAETGVIDCGAQICDGGGNATGYHFEVYGLENNKLSEDLSFTVNEDNSITCDQDGYTMYISDEGDYNGYTWDGHHWDVTLYPENGKMQGRRNVTITTGWSGWGDYSIPVAVEDFEYSVNIYNMCGMGCASIDINDDGTISMAVGQPMYEVSSNNVEKYGPYFTLKCVGVDSEGYMFIDDTKDVISGTINGNTITFTDIFINCSDLTEDGYGIFDGYYRSGSTITLNDGNFTAGIEEVGLTREEKIKNSKTYNLMGQQVNRKEAAKGILIRDGKKFINRK